MDVFTENLQAAAAASKRVVVQEERGGETPAALIQAALFPALECDSPVLGQFGPPSVPAPISRPGLGGVGVSDMSLVALVEPSSASMNGFFPSLPLVSSSASSLASDASVGLVSSSSMVDLSSFEPPPALSPSGSSSPTSSASLTLSPSPFTSADVFSALSGVSQASLACAEVFGASREDIRCSGASSTLASSASELTLLSSLPRVEGSLLPPLEVSSCVQAAAVAADTSSFASISTPDEILSAVLPSTSVPGDDPFTSLPSISDAVLPASPPSYSIEELSPLPAVAEPEVDVRAPPVALPLPDTDSFVSAEQPVRASTGVSTGNDLSALEASPIVSCAFPSLAPDVPPTVPSHSLCQLPDPSPSLASASSFVQSSVPLKLESSRTPQSFLSCSMSTPCLALLSSVDVVASGAPLAAASRRQLGSNPGPGLSVPSSSLDRLAPSGALFQSAESKVISLPSSSTFGLDASQPASTAVAPSTVLCSLSSASSIPSIPIHVECANGDSFTGFGEAMDCSPCSSTRFRSGVGNSANGKDEVTPSSHELRSVSEEEAVNDGPPRVPNIESLYRKSVRGGQKGEGWPYAPQGWPDSDDKWCWRVGRRLHRNGYFRDRFLGLPKSLSKGKKTAEFGSIRAVVDYLRQNFPKVPVENFFKSFQWKVPYTSSHDPEEGMIFPTNTQKRQRQSEGSEDFRLRAKKVRKGCSAGNPKCGLETGRSILLGPVQGLTCDVCCSEPGFCRECKCILCCKIIQPEAGDCNLVRCLQRPTGNGICGHAAHLECALRSKMAGVVKKRDLDMEYLCRRCDKKTDLRELVTILLETIGSMELRTQAEKSLELALEIMKGTTHGGSGAKVLESLVQTALRKVQNGADIREVFSDLKDQGTAAESARQHNSARGMLLDDATQQPEASLDQWLPSSGSPTSHPSPGTPSSFTSPLMRGNPSVTSAQPIGTDYIDRSAGKQTVSGDQFGPQGPRRLHHNSGSKHSHLATKSLMRNGMQARVNHRVHVASSNDNGVHETMCDSYNNGAAGNCMPEKDLRDGGVSQWENYHSDSGTKGYNDERGPHDEGIGRDAVFSMQTCKSCGAMRQDAATGFEVMSSGKSPKLVKGGKNVLGNSWSHRGEPNASGNFKRILGSDGKVIKRGYSGSNSPVNGYNQDTQNTLHLLRLECEQDVQTALQRLRQSQDAEFEHAKQRLTAQQGYILREYKLLESSLIELARPDPSSLEGFDRLIVKAASQFAKATKERENFKSMLKVAEGFGNVPKDDLKRLYGWPLKR